MADTLWGMKIIELPSLEPDKWFLARPPSQEEMLGLIQNEIEKMIRLRLYPTEAEMRQINELRDVLP